MDKKNSIIIFLITALVAVIGFFAYNTKKQQEVQQQSKYRFLEPMYY